MKEIAWKFRRFRPENGRHFTSLPPSNFDWWRKLSVMARVMLFYNKWTHSHLGFLDFFISCHIMDVVCGLVETEQNRTFNLPTICKAAFTWLRYVYDKKMSFHFWYYCWMNHPIECDKKEEGSLAEKAVKRRHLSSHVNTLAGRQAASKHDCLPARFQGSKHSRNCLTAHNLKKEERVGGRGGKKLFSEISDGCKFWSCSFGLSLQSFPVCVCVCVCT